MSQVYSTQFMAGLTPAGGVLTYTVPAGYAAVLRSIDLGINGAVGAAPGVAVSGISAFWFPSLNVANPFAQWRGRQVLKAGQTLGIGAATSFFVLASGYLLSLP